MIRTRLMWGLVFLGLGLPAAAAAKTGPTVYTAARQAAAYDNAAYSWSEADSHIGYTQPWLNLSLARIHELVPHPSLPRAHQVRYDTVCPNGKPLRRWFVDPNIRFKVKCIDTDDTTADVWYPQNDFETHYKRNSTSDGEYVYPATDTTYCDPQIAANDCGYGAVIGGKRWYFVAHYVYATLSSMARLDLGDPVNGRSLAWSGSLTAVFEGPTAGLPAARRVAMLLAAFARYFAGNVTWYPIHLQRDPNLLNFVDSGGVWLGRVIDGLVLFNLIRAYDITFAVWDDAQLLAALAAVHPGETFTGASLRTEVAESLFWPASQKVMSMDIWGNATLPHDVLLHIAWVLDEGARSQALINWVFGESQGRLPELFINSIDRDGGCDEVSAAYCRLWYGYILDTGELLDHFNAGDFPLQSSYQLPIPGLAVFERRISLLFGWARQLETMPGFYVHLGDEGPTDTPGLPALPSLEELARAFMHFGHDPQLAAQLYERNGNSTAGLHTSIWDAAPFAVQQDVQTALQSDPALRRNEVNLAGYGFAQLRHLSGTPSSVWTYFGRNQYPLGSFGHHGHHDQLDFGMQYANSDFMPTPGYPSNFGWRYFAWEANTPSHNAVIVDRTTQSRRVWASDIQSFLDTPGSPVTVMSLQSRTAYPGVYEWPAQLANAALNRRLVKVPLGDGPFFVVELSSTRGGSVHHYSYHGGGPSITGGNLTSTNLTYGAIDSGAAVPYESAYDFDEVDATCRASQSCVESNAYLYRGTGFSFLTNTAYTNTPPQTTHYFWNQYNWQTGAVLSGVYLHAYVTPLANINQIALATGLMPKGQPVRYMIVRGANGSTGSALINVWEPVSGSALISSVALLGSNVSASNVAAALQVTLTDGRVFYVGLDEAGATPRSYGNLAWLGKVAVYAEQGGTKTRGGKGKPKPSTPTKLFAYLAEGESLSMRGVAQLSGESPAMTGTVAGVDATATTSALYTTAALDATEATNRWVDLRTASPDAYTLWRDATFRVFGVTLDGGTYRMNLGDVPLAGRYLDTSNYSLGIKQLAAPGDTFRIPLDTWN